MRRDVVVSAAGTKARPVVSHSVLVGDKGVRRDVVVSAPGTKARPVVSHSVLVGDKGVRRDVVVSAAGTKARPVCGVTLSASAERCSCICGWHQG